MKELRQQIIDIALRAGEVILDIYGEKIAVETKSDNSPLTRADLASNRVICEQLAQISPDTPILTEESAQAAYAERRNWSRFWLVDPLDGTKEFIKRNGEFTVNIALVEDGRPVLAVVHAPALSVTYSASVAEGAFRHDNGKETPLRVRPVSGRKLRVVISRSHAGESTRLLLERLESQYEVESVSRGSSLKLCLVAEGAADFYPRLGPTMEWDTAAAQAIVEAAGGVVLSLPERQALRYNKEVLKNPQFAVASGSDAAYLDALAGL